ncbi:TetR family transcriptional regulator C-terminal domain-containing protein [Nocardia ninae]|uniref:TetR family transcriptional regulator C-terminal domain-containing protein n=1 Tax=Nocardia ninae TaxID=356145 RepID=UPI001C996A48|nr:TetR family transcriptional regulator C-terminal domain-containing protein [Nocardia ninae]
MSRCAEVGDRIGQRLSCHRSAALRGLTGRRAVDALQSLLEELLPIDEERRVETIVLLEFIVAARTKPVFRPVTEQMAGDMRQVVTDALRGLAVLEPREQTALLTAIIEGLSLDAVTPNGSLGVERLRRTLRAHIRSLLV